MKRNQSVQVESDRVVVHAGGAAITIRLDDAADYLVAVNRGDGRGKTEIIPR